MSATTAARRQAFHDQEIYGWSTRLFPRATTGNEELLTRLNAAGLRTGRGRRFDIDAVQWIRHVHKIPTPGPFAPGEISIAAAAARLGISANAVYHWIQTGHLPACRATGNRLALTWTPAVEAACRARICSSGHLTPKAQPVTTGEAV